MDKMNKFEQLVELKKHWRILKDRKDYYYMNLKTKYLSIINKKIDLLDDFIDEERQFKIECKGLIILLVYLKNRDDQELIQSLKKILELIDKSLYRKYKSELLMEEEPENEFMRLMQEICALYGSIEELLKTIDQIKEIEEVSEELRNIIL